MLHVHNSVAHDFNEDVVEGAVFILGYHYWEATSKKFRG